MQRLLVISAWCPNLFKPGEIARIEDNSTGGKHKSAEGHGKNRKVQVDADKPTI